MELSDADDGVVEARRASSVRRQSLEEQALDVPYTDIQSAAYDSLFIPGFSVPVFLRQVVQHLTFPVGLLWYPHREFPHGMRNQHLRPTTMLRDERLFFFVTVSPFLCWVIFALFFLFRDRFEDSRVGFDEIFFVPMVMLTARIIAIGVKYATMSTPASVVREASVRDRARRRTKKEHRKYMTVDYATASHYALQLQLLTGFISLRDDVIDTELRLAAARLGLRLGEMRFSSVDDGDDENARVWDDLMRIGLEDAGDPEWREAFRELAGARSPKAQVSLDASWPLRQLSTLKHAQHLNYREGGSLARDFPKVAKAFYRLANRASPLRFVIALAFLFALVVAGLGPLMRVFDGHPPFGRDPLVPACCALATVIVLANAPFVVGFLATTALHNYRRHLVLSWLVRLTRLNRGQHLDYPHARFPARFFVSSKTKRPRGRDEFRETLTGKTKGNRHRRVR